MVSSSRSPLLRLLVCCAALLISAGAAWRWSPVSPGSTVTTAERPLATRANAIQPGTRSARTSTAPAAFVEAGDRPWSAVGAPDLRRLPRRAWRRATTRRMAREWQAGLATTLHSGSNPLVLALIQDGGARPARVAARSMGDTLLDAGSPRAPPTGN